MGTLGRNGRPYRRARAAVLKPGSRCWLCGIAIDFTARPRTRWAPSADHLHPVSLGGHALGPMKPAHYGCNAARGNGTKPRRTPPSPRFTPARRW